MMPTKGADIPGSGELGTRKGQFANGAGPVVSIFIVAYNSTDFIDECISAVAGACTQHSYEILLVDNGDGSTERLVAERYPDVRIAPSKGNVGFAAGNNLLAEHARANLYLLLNPDMICQPGAIDALVAGTQAHPDAAAWGGVSLGKDGRPDTGNALAVPTLHELFSVAMGKSSIGSGVIAGLEEDAEVDVLMGGLVMIRKSAWDEANGLDERFFLYCEEVDLFYRLRQKGHKLWRICDARGVHDAAHGQSFSPRRQLYRTTGIMEFARHHWSLPAIWLAGLLIWFAAVTRLVAGRLLGWMKPRLRKLAESNVVVAKRPWLWFHGYHPRRGLLPQLENKKVPGL
ncbi:glycosyltransferase family 2 protein [Aurantiacibacter poecillastricola]|uniref:glycosyltransferase family 2 protein n=1 Tax=Aurantiacibacter poecillastricola TaxID=3064385 RepID=UPI00273F91B2|nr:glycosyltransferase family 2 protein [Aurantiacibacter sp. 219JJ12-13]MDP5260703.1 glycosyltransferase family 2 protein [Aurantiacibacter sp. 219JJ12-13]